LADKNLRTLKRKLDSTDAKIQTELLRAGLEQIDRDAPPQPKKKIAEMCREISAAQIAVVDLTSSDSEDDDSEIIDLTADDDDDDSSSVSTTLIKDALSSDDSDFSHRKIRNTICDDDDNDDELRSINPYETAPVSLLIEVAKMADEEAWYQGEMDKKFSKDHQRKFANLAKQGGPVALPKCEKARFEAWKEIAQDIKDTLNKPLKFVDNEILEFDKVGKEFEPQGHYGYEYLRLRKSLKERLLSNFPGQLKNIYFSLLEMNDYEIEAQFGVPTLKKTRLFGSIIKTLRSVISEGDEIRVQDDEHKQWKLYLDLIHN
jgi:hypothetical protein